MKKQFKVIDGKVKFSSGKVSPATPELQVLVEIRELLSRMVVALESQPQPQSKSVTKKNE